MPSTITFIKNINRKFVSSYRPIEVWARLNEPDVAYLRGELYIEEVYGSNNYVSTGALINGYEQSSLAGGMPGLYSFNLMEFVRHYVGKANCIPISLNAWSLPGYFETNRFYLKIWAVRYTSNLGITYDDYSTQVNSNIFIATPANLSNDISTDVFNDNIHLDRYVLGNNGSAPAPGTVLPLTKMPNMPNYVKENGFMIDMEDFPCDSLYTYWNKNKDNELLHLIVIRYNDGVNYSGADIIKLGDQFSRKERIPVHPIALSSFITMVTGSAYYNIVNISGNLICKKVEIGVVSGNSPTGFFPTNWWSTTNFKTGVKKGIYRTITYSDVGAQDGCEGGGKQRTKFIFQNSLGGFDWFSCYGTREESVTIKDERYDKQRYLMMREHHTSTKLITTRQDNIKVFSQPLGKERAMFLAELYASPKVWVQQKMQHSENSGTWGEYRLTPINIVAGSWDLYSIENNLYFLEFEYNYSEQKTQPRG